MAAKNVISRCVGLNTVLDPFLPVEREDGHKYLSVALDVDIDDSSAISRRLGQTEVSSVASHSAFRDGGDAFVVQDRSGDAAIYRLTSGPTLTGVRSGLTKAAKVSFSQVGAKTFYVNGYQNGVITDGASAAWPVGTYSGPDTLNEFSSAPVGHMIAYHKGRMWVAVGNVIYCSEPYKPGLFRLAKCFFQFAGYIGMIRPVDGGVWVSDSQTTGFISTATEKWDGYKYIRKSEVPAHAWSANHTLVKLVKTKWQIPGLSAVWSSDEGLCIGTPDGQLIVETEGRLEYPTGSSGAMLVNGLIAINSVY